MTTNQQTDAARPLPWIYPLLLAVIYNGDAVFKQFGYVATGGGLVPILLFRFAALFALAGLLLVRQPPRRPPSPRMLLCMAALVGYAALGLTVSIFNADGGPTFYPPLKALVIVLTATLGVWTVYRVLATPSDLRRFAAALVFFAVWIAITIIPEVAAGNVASLMEGRHQQFGLFGLPIPSRQGIGIRIAPFILMPFLLAHSEGGVRRRFVSGVLIAGAVTAFGLLVLLSGHRAALGGMVLALAYRTARRASLLTALQIGGGVLLIAVLLANLSPDFRVAAERGKMMLDIQSVAGDKSVRERESAYRVAWALFAENPVVGVGFGEFKRAMGDEGARGIYPHNIALEYMSDAGFAGLAVLLLLVGVTGWTLTRLRSEAGLAVAGMFIVFFSIALVSGDFIGNTGMYILIGAFPLLEEMGRDEKTSNARAKPAAATVVGADR